MTSFASVSVMLGLEERFAITFPESVLQRTTFESIRAITNTIAQLRAESSARRPAERGLEADRLTRAAGIRPPSAAEEAQARDVPLQTQFRVLVTLGISLMPRTLRSQHPNHIRSPWDGLEMSISRK